MEILIFNQEFLHLKPVKIVSTWAIAQKFANQKIWKFE